MIKSLRIKNFKSWQDTGTMPFSKLTGFFGPNSSGKTSILQWLLLLKQTAESSDSAHVLNFGDESTYVNLGTYRDVFHQQHISDVANGSGPSDNVSMDWSIEWNLPKPLEIADPESKAGLLFSLSSLAFDGSVS